MRKLATAAFSFAAGIFLAQTILPRGLSVWLAAGCLLLGLLGFLRQGTTRRRIFLIAGGLAAALVWNFVYVGLVQLPAETLTGTERAVTMTLCDYARATDSGAKATVRVEGAGLFGVRAVYYGDESLLDLTPGNTVSDTVFVSSAAKIQDETLTSFTSKGVFLLLYSQDEALSAAGSSGSPRWWPARAGEALRRQIGLLFDGDAAAFLTAVLTGDKSGLSSAAVTSFSEAGIYHVLAISGMHCAFLLGMIAFLTGRNRRRLLAALAIPALLFYMVLAGCTPSVVRACVMLILVLLAPLFRRESDQPTALATALALILLQNPFAIASISLQLSFAAMAGLIWMAPAVYRLLLPKRRGGRTLRFLAASVSASLGATVFTAPLCAWYFNIFWLVAPLSNLLCLMVVSLAFGFGLAAVLLSFAWLSLGGVLAWIPRGLIWYLMEMTGLLSRIPYHAVYFSNPYLKYWLAFAYFLWLATWMIKDGSRRKYLTALAVTATTLAVCVGLGALRYSYGSLRVDVLDVGQGQSVLYASDGTYALLDCGSGNSWYDAGDVAADALLSAGCHRLDYLILTHYDYDHVSGLETLLDRIPVKALLAPDVEDDSGMREWVLAAAEKAGTPVNFVTAAETCSLGEAALRIYPPLGDGGDNERGLTLLCSAGDFDVLDTGDMGTETEETLLADYRLPDIEALIVGHHGSKYSTGEELLETVTPEVGIISVGSNRYGHPTAQTLRRLVNANVTVYRTDLQGTIHLCVN